jgi:hypothetical protein
MSGITALASSVRVVDINTDSDAGDRLPNDVAKSSIALFRFP